MVLNIIALAILLITACIIGAFIIRKLPQLASIEVGAIPEERLAELKKHLAMERMIRKVRVWLVNFAFLKDIVDYFSKRINSVFDQLRMLERRLFLNKTKDISGVLHAARLVQDIDPGEAERLLLEVIKTDHKNVEAYESLAEIYTSRKEWQEAAEAWQFLAKLNPVKKNRYLFELVGALQEGGNTSRALAVAYRLVKEFSVEPRVLDIFIELAILMSDKMKAIEGLIKLKDVNPENAKISEFEKKIEAMP